MLTVIELTNPFAPAIALDAPVENAVSFFQKSAISMLPVVENGLFRGVLERSRLESLSGFSCARVRDLLCVDILYLSPNDDAEHAADLLATGMIDLVPVVNDDGQFAGTITAAEVPERLWAESLTSVA